MNRPRVTVKWAQSVDGRLATATGDSKWITGVEARTAAHQLRSEHQALLVGIGTVLADDPQLTVRLVSGHAPLRVVLDSALRTPAQARLLHGGGRVLIFGARECAGLTPSRMPAGAEVVLVPTGQDGLDLSAVLAELAARGVESLMVEGGARVITAFIKSRLADDLAIFVAPKLLGSGREAVENLGIERIDQALAGKDVAYQRLGEDLLVRMKLTN